MSEKTYLKKFKIFEKFDSLPDNMEINLRGHLILTRTKIDMIPAGVKGIYFVFFDKKPRYVAPDFDGIIMYNANRSIKDMDPYEVKIAKYRYIADREIVEKPRYIKNEDATLSLCSLPTDMRIFHKPFEGGYFLDLTRTSVKEKQNLGGFKDVILYPKKAVQQEFPFVLSNKVTHHQKSQVMCSKQKTYGQ